MARARVGDRVRMTGIMRDDPSPLPIGTEGEVFEVLNEGRPQSQVCVRWDNGSTLMLLSNDPYEVIRRADQ